jgi:predicted transposase
MRSGMPKAEPSKVFQGAYARLVFPDHRDEAAVLDLMRRFSSATRFAYQRLLEGQDRKELKREDGPLCTLFGLNTRYADGAIEKAQATLDSARELGQDPRKVVFGGRKLFEQLIPFYANAFVLGHQWNRVCRLRVSGSWARTRHRSATTSIISSRSRKYRLATASFTKGHTRSTGCSSGL